MTGGGGEKREEWMHGRPWAVSSSRLGRLRNRRRKKGIIRTSTLEKGVKAQHSAKHNHAQPAVLVHIILRTSVL